jgi:choline kinase
MLEVTGLPLAPRAIKALRAAGFERIVAVTGHAAGELDHLGIETRFNDRWESENNIVSLWQVRDIVREGCVIVNCDVLFDPEIARRVAELAGTVLLVDDEMTVDEESMKVTLNGDGDLDGLHKSLPLDAAVGEYIGLTRVDPADGPRLAEILDEMVENGEVQVYYEDALARLATERPVGIERVGGLSWIEIDDHDDLARAQAEIAPVVDRALANVAPTADAAN